MLAVNNIYKSIGEKNILNGISLNIEKGKFYSLLGPNGAGKTTTINIITSLLKPDKGEVHINGINIFDKKQDIKYHIGVVPQEIALYDDLTAWQNLMFWGSSYKLSQSELNKNAQYYLHIFGLEDRKNNKVKTFSGGMKRRLNIACGLLHRPKLVLMDEPTVGIDPQSRNNIYDALEKLKNQEITILYTTHYMQEAEKFSDCIGIIDEGKIITQGSLDELRKASGINDEITIVIKNKPHQMPHYYIAYYTEGNSLHFNTESAKNDLPKIISFCLENNLEIEQVEIKKVNLENIFLKLTGKKLRDK